MAEETVRIAGGEGVLLDGRLDPLGGRVMAVLCHPHPLYGGSMDNNVVLAARDALAPLGIGTLRFDFRGVGRSTGGYGEGIGEAEDVEAAFALLASRGAARRLVVAYSFGAYAALRAVDRGLAPDAIALVSPPVTFMDFEPLALPDCPCLIAAGDGDDYCSLDDLEAWIESQPGEPAPLERVVFDETDHFYWGREEDLGEALARFFRAFA